MFHTEGASGKITYFENSVIKKTKKDSMIDEIEYHQLAYQITENMQILRVPAILNIWPNKYEMEKIDCNKELHFSKFQLTELDSFANFFQELKFFFNKMIERNIFPFDFELYLQPDKTIMMIDFDKFCKINNNQIKVGKFTLDLKSAYYQPSLPIGFKL